MLFRVKILSGAIVCIMFTNILRHKCIYLRFQSSESSFQFVIVLL